MATREDINDFIRILLDDPELRLEVRKAIWKGLPRARVNDIPTECSYCGSPKVYARGYCRNCYHRWLSRGTPEYAERPKKKEHVPEKELRMLHWREAYVQNLFQFNQFAVPEDFAESVDLFISSLPERTRYCVHEYFEKGRTLDDIGQEIGISRERVRQILKGRSPRSGTDPRLLILGKKELDRKQQLIIEEKNRAEQEMAEAEREQDAAAKKAKWEQNLANLSPEIFEPADGVRILNLHLEELDLNVRAFNCIVRSIPIDMPLTTESLIRMYIKSGESTLFDYFCTIRNMGVKSAVTAVEAFRSKCVIKEALNAAS